jgi:hypothetical protein
MQMEGGVKADPPAQNSVIGSPEASRLKGLWRDGLTRRSVRYL